MRFFSTRGGASECTLDEAIVAGLAPDGGLYVPEQIPSVPAMELEAATDLPDVATRLLAPFFAGSFLDEALPEIVAESISFPAPLRPVQEGDERLSVLELFHGPTASFKDFGARFLAACLARATRRNARPVVILVATSGDTGSAVAAAFHRRPGFRVALLFPAGKVSPVQEQQLTCWGDNVQSLAVHGDFDDCQRLVKQAFGDPALTGALALSSANSINAGRLLPQMTWFAAASLAIQRREGGNASFVIPSGNLGHAVACAFAREAGLPIGHILLAHNANRTVPDYLQSGEWRPRPSIATLATAMDVGNPSNMERLNWVYRDHARLNAGVRAVSVTDDEIRASIRHEFVETGLSLCPHGATAAHAYRTLPARDRRSAHWVVIATAHPAKFPEIVAPLIGEPVRPPASVAAMSGRRTSRLDIDPDYGQLQRALLGPSGRKDRT